MYQDYTVKKILEYVLQYLNVINAAVLAQMVGHVRF
jgi:hypothetical protein